MCLVCGALVEDHAVLVLFQEHGPSESACHRKAWQPLFSAKILKHHP